MKLVQINRNDIIGGRFNGFSIRQALRQHGVDSTHLVWNPPVHDPQVRPLTPYPGFRRFVKWASKFEERNSWHSMLQVQAFALAAQREFRQADVVHYHIIHDGYFSLAALPFLTNLKPSVWTWHDPWPMTGHCIYPMACDGWQRGCDPCPHLDYHFPMREDKAGLAYRQKRSLINRSDVDVVLASDWMMQMARRSPMAANARLHQIPFGVDLALYKPRDRRESRKRFGIGADNVVIALRSIMTAYKGLNYVIDALERIKTETPITIIGMQEAGHFNRFIGKHQIIELGWVNDDDLMVDALSAADIFSMTSTAEAFGLMAVEAMACGLPVVVFEGTSLPEVVFAPDVGIATPMRDADALAAAFQRLIDNPSERRARGARARVMAELHYDERLYVERLAKLYAQVARRSQGRKEHRQ